VRYLAQHQLNDGLYASLVSIFGRRHHVILGNLATSGGHGVRSTTRGGGDGAGVVGGGLLRQRMNGVAVNRRSVVFCRIPLDGISCFSAGAASSASLAAGSTHGVAAAKKKT